ncbi:S66 peptidase family protein [Oceanobacillus chungangensis]|uniref:LD-carboxypeptidase n=1 Tax=Oceanobacillus chungangensis TaxID=1229152 RepID=A0A3D8PZ04_9BACI|nr:LD-carboxypeptidase [Oceanobacillus chungangensis]RDW20561.1 LD-carboxypeptidase [Oceanobacillus chungangensis]
MLYPMHLEKGDRIGVIAPAGPPDLEKTSKSISFFEAMGLQVKFGKHLNRTHGYLAGTDEERLIDFHEMIADRSIKAVFCARGGYGTARITPYLNFELIKQNPKIIWGYSDITYLHTAIRQETGLITFHGPMLSDISRNNFDSLSGTLFKQLFEPTILTYSETISPLQVITDGEAEGPLVGGNLSLISSSIGTPFELDVKDKLLLIEDIAEEPYKIDGMLNQLKLAGKLDDAAGIIVGDFADAESKLPNSLTLGQVLLHYFAELTIPVISGFKIGHCLPHFSVPLGAIAKLSTIDKTLVIQPGVA